LKIRVLDILIVKYLEYNYVTYMFRDLKLRLKYLEESIDFDLDSQLNCYGLGK